MVAFETPALAATSLEVTGISILAKFCKYCATGYINIFYMYSTEVLKCQAFGLLKFKMSHSMRNYGDETNDKDYPSP
jgi:hypothetical protein